MQFKQPAVAGVAVKATRGLAYDDAVYRVRPDAFIVGRIKGGVDLKAGEETPIPVTVPNLPPNANVRRMTATLEVVSGSAAQATPVSVKEGTAAPRTYEVKVDEVPGLRNLQVRLQGGMAIWSHAGAAKADRYPLPDFAEQVNTYLDQAHPDGSQVVLEFLVKSETAGSVKMTIDDLEFTLLQTQSWKNDLDATFRMDRNLQMEFNSVEILPLDALAEPAAVIRSAIRLDAAGQFGPERLLGDVETPDGGQSATISPDYAVAQSFELNPDRVKKSVQCTGVSLWLTADAPAELYVELQPDADGAPGSSATLTSANVSFEPPEEGAAQSWTFAPFEGPTEVNLGTRYWVVVKVASGSAQMGLRDRSGDGAGDRAVQLGPAAVNRGGQRWKCLVTAPGAREACDPSVVALVGLVYLPESDNQTAAVEIGVHGGSVRERIDPTARAQNVTLDMSGDKRKDATLVLRSHARGILTLANVVQEYTRA